MLAAAHLCMLQCISAHACTFSDGCVIESPLFDLRTCPCMYSVISMLRKDGVSCVGVPS